MANIKSAKKRILQNQKRTDINKYRRSRIRSGIKSLNSSLAKKKKEPLILKLKSFSKNF